MNMIISEYNRWKKDNSWMECDTCQAVMRFDDMHIHTHEELKANGDYRHTVFSFFADSLRTKLPKLNRAKRIHLRRRKQVG